MFVGNILTQKGSAQSSASTTIAEGDRVVMEFMQAIAWTEYGAPDVLKLKEFEKPVPKNNEVFIKIHASAVTVGDCRLRASRVPGGFWLLTRLAFGLTKPRKAIPGMDLSGEIVSVGQEVTLFKIGDRVYGTAGMKLGANAEYICLPETSALVLKPNSVSHEQAVAVIFGGLTALHFLRDKASIKRDQKILINGASGAVGTASIQLANYFGAEVTAVCSTVNINLVKSLGAKQVIDYTKNDFAKSSDTYDMIFDAVGNLSMRQCEKSLKKQGKLVLISVSLLTNLLSLVKRNVICGAAGESKEALQFLSERIEAGDITAIIDRVYPLEKTADAHQYVDTGRKKGNVVISVEKATLRI